MAEAAPHWGPSSNCWRCGSGKLQPCRHLFTKCRPGSQRSGDFGKASGKHSGGNTRGRRPSDCFSRTTARSPQSRLSFGRPGWGKRRRCPLGRRRGGSGGNGTVPGGLGGGGVGQDQIGRTRRAGPALPKNAPPLFHCEYSLTVYLSFIYLSFEGLGGRGSGSSIMTAGFCGCVEARRAGTGKGKRVMHIVAVCCLRAAVEPLLWPFMQRGSR